MKLCSPQLSVRMECQRERDFIVLFASRRRDAQLVAFFGTSCNLIIKQDNHIFNLSRGIWFIKIIAKEKTSNKLCFPQKNAGWVSGAASWLSSGCANSDAEESAVARLSLTAYLQTARPTGNFPSHRRGKQRLNNEQVWFVFHLSDTGMKHGTEPLTY